MVVENVVVLNDTHPAAKQTSCVCSFDDDESQSLSRFPTTKFRCLFFLTILGCWWDYIPPSFNPLFHESSRFDCDLGTTVLEVFVTIQQVNSRHVHSQLAAPASNKTKHSAKYMRFAFIFLPIENYLWNLPWRALWIVCLRRLRASGSSSHSLISKIVLFLFRNIPKSLLVSSSLIRKITGYSV